ncbi:MAG TPA: SusC/RagA family TonB-linked outer membrane protein, partial [Porphyromonadaceae bacterium]|nr:SusC/RagA family TonB-linked outer membrane protein [Porphyromonadaceae bacterium]
GVVLVTTRKGKEGKPVISGRVEYGVMSPTKMPKMTDALEFMKLYNDVYKEDNNGNVFYTEEEMNKYLTGVDPDLYPNVNWMEEIYKDMTTSQRVNINISGGGKNVR